MLNARFAGMVLPPNKNFVSSFRSFFVGTHWLDSPIPRPEPVEQLRCNETKEYAGDGICFPVASSTNSAFSIQEIFGRSINGVCPVSQPIQMRQVHLQVFPSMRIDPPPASMADGQAHFSLTGRPAPFSPRLMQTNPLIYMFPSMKVRHYLPQRRHR